MEHTGEMRHLQKDPLIQLEGKGSSLFCSFYIISGHKPLSKYLLCFFLSKDTCSMFSSYVCITVTVLLGFYGFNWLLFSWLKVNGDQREIKLPVFSSNCSPFSECVCIEPTHFCIYPSMKCLENWEDFFLIFFPVTEATVQQTGTGFCRVI